MKAEAAGKGDGVGDGALDGKLHKGKEPLDIGMGGKVNAAHSVGAVPLVVDADLLGHRDRQLVFPMGVLALGGVSQHGVGVVPASHFPHRVEIKALIAGLAAGLGIGQPGYVFQLVSGGLVLIIGGDFRVGVIQVFRVSHGRTEESPRAPIPIPNRARLEVFTSTEPTL